MDEGMVDVSFGASGVVVSGGIGVVVEAALCSSRRVNNGGALSRLNAEDLLSSGSAVDVCW
jgi:hypothetical protein